MLALAVAAFAGGAAMIFREELRIAGSVRPVEGKANVYYMEAVDTEKPDLTVTTAIRLVLNRAATVDKAVALLGQYDIHPSGGISHHLAISDASGASVSVEFVGGEMVVVETDCVTNFNLANGDTAAGGESAQERYELLCAVHQEMGGILAADEVKDALWRVSRTEGEWRTQWSVVYRQDTQTLDYYFNAQYDSPVSFSVHSEAGSVNWGV